MTPIDISPIINAAVFYVAPIVGAVVAAGAAWLVSKLNQILKKHGVNVDLQIDAKHREALHTAATNLAGQLIVTGAAKLDPSGQIHVEHQEVAKLANVLIVRVPAAVKHFGITPEKAANLIVEKLGLATTADVPQSFQAFSGNGSGT